jgi:hypothetical protein
VATTDLEAVRTAQMRWATNRRIRYLEEQDRLLREIAESTHFDPTGISRSVVEGLTALAVTAAPARALGCLALLGSQLPDEMRPMTADGEWSAPVDAAALAGWLLPRPADELAAFLATVAVVTAGSHALPSEIVQAEEAAAVDAIRARPVPWIERTEPARAVA